jgi:two-component system sensor histidine kinase SenX3
MSGTALALAAVVGLAAGAALGLLWGRRQAGRAVAAVLAGRASPDQARAGGPPAASGAERGLSGSLLGIRSLVAEAQEARSAEHRSTERLQRTLDGIPHGLVLFDRDGQVRFANATGAGFVNARHGAALVEREMRELVEEITAGATGVRSRAVELEGPPRAVYDVAARPLLDAEGGSVVVIEDVTERRRLDEVRRDFVTNISHELRTPVGALSLLTETMADEEDSEVTRRLARRVHGEATRLARSIEDLLLLSEIEADGELRWEPVPLLAVIDDAFERMAGAAAERNVELVIDHVPAELVVWGDRRQLASAVYNLVDNGVKYSDAGGAVVVRAAADEDRVRLEVEDCGIGIPARDLERVFERFYRVDRARSRRTGGTGLGLAIVRHVARNHGGEVAVRSREGEGSTFTVTLPAGPHPHTAPDVDDVGSRAQEEFQPS